MITVEHTTVATAADDATKEINKGDWNGTGAHTLAGTISLTADVSGILPTANGGSGIAYFTAAGPTQARVYTFPDAAATIARTDAGQTFSGTQTFNGTTNIFEDTATGNSRLQITGSNHGRVEVTDQNATSGYRTYQFISDGAKFEIRRTNDAVDAVLATPFSINNDHVTLGVGAPATTATVGFPQLPVMAGTPTGVPTAITGYSPYVYDSTGQKVWVYDFVAAAWKSMAGSGGASLDAVTAAVADQTGILNANYEIIWKWAKTQNTETALRLTESAASTGGNTVNGIPNQVLLKLDTLAASTMSPLSVYSNAAHVFSVSAATRQIHVALGTPAAPIIAWAAATNTGFYSDDGGALSVSINGVETCRFESAQLNVPAGTAAAPGLIDLPNSNTGLFFPSVVVGISLAGTEHARFAQGIFQPSKGSADAVAYAMNFRKSRGTVASPTVITTGDAGCTWAADYYVGPTSTYQRGSYIEQVSTGTISDSATGIGGIIRFYTAVVGAEPAEVLTLMGGTTTGGGWAIMDEADASPTTTELDADDSVAMYNKAGKIVFAYNLAGVMNYLVGTLDGATTAWTNSTTAP